MTGLGSSINFAAAGKVLREFPAAPQRGVMDEPGGEGPPLPGTGEGSYGMCSLPTPIQFSEDFAPLESANEFFSYPWGRLDYICNSKTNKSVSVSVISEKLIWKQFKSVSVISRVQV